MTSLRDLRSSARIKFTKLLNLPETGEGVSEELLELIWKSYPPTDKIKHFERTRTLRSSKQQVYATLRKIFLEESITPEQMVKCIEAEVNLRVSQSLRENKLTYMKNMLTWLRAKEYESWLNHEEDNPTDMSSVTGELE